MVSIHLSFPLCVGAALAFDDGDGEEARLYADEVPLVGDDGLDVLVGAGGLLHVALAADGVDYALGLEVAHLLGHVQGLDGGGAREGAAGAVGAGAERVRVAEALDDVGGRALRAGDDARDALAGQRGALAVDDDVATEMMLHGGIVVGYVDHLLEGDTRQRVGENLLDALHHELAVAVGEIDAVFHLVPVHAELSGRARQEGQADFGRHGRVPALVQGGSEAVVVVADELAEVARAGVDHHPEVVVLILLQLDEVVAAAEGAHLFQDRRLAALDNLHALNVVALGQTGGVLRLLVVVHAQRDAPAYAAHNLLAQYVGRQLRGLPGGLQRTHAAADVHAHGVRNHGIRAGQHAADGHAHAGMHVGHNGQVVVEERQRRQILYLRHGRSLHLVRPDLHRTSIYHLYIHSVNSSELIMLAAASSSQAAM